MAGIVQKREGKRRRSPGIGLDQRLDSFALHYMPISKVKSAPPSSARQLANTILPWRPQQNPQILKKPKIISLNQRNLAWIEPADGDGPVAAAAEEIPQPERRSVRRRLVQSTLFPHKSPENCEQKLDRNCNGEDDDYQAKEYRGSQNNKRTRRGKGKTTPPTRTPKKSKEKSLMDGTPEKNGSSNGKGIGNLIENQDASPPIPNLRLEAKMTAEENSRLFAGKQIHPFFSTWKVSKRCNKTTEVESNYCSAKIKDKSINIGPIHVFERDQDDARPLDWSDWELCEEPFTNSSYSLEGPFSSNFEGFGSLDINEFPCASHPPSTSLQDNASLDQCLYQKESVCEAPLIFSSTPSDAQDCKVVEGGLFSGCTRKSDAEQQTDLLQERTDSSYLTCTNQLEDDRLWTDKYQPKKATEVCGNDESVKLLSEWLCSWQQRGCQPSTDTFSGDVCDRQDADYTCSQSNSDLENNNEGASLKNVLLITGPTGCGKSSAIYACAREEGFKVLEVNASECRNGAVVKQRFGEALESHSIEWSQEIHVETQSNKIAKFSLALPDGKLTPDFDSKMIEMIPISNKDNSLGATVATTTCASKESTIACDREQLKHLILFEDVDITFTEDRGFVSAIQQIAEKAKGPVILTSNSENPVLPASLDRLEVSFMMPSKKELLQHAYMVCSAEKVNIQPHLLEQVVEYCQGDIRKTIMHLQFWFQGKRIRKLPPGREAPRLFGPLMFDPEAGHRALPKMMPWNFPSHLSELVEKDITNSLSMMEEENYVSMEVIEEDFKDKEMQNNSKIHNYGKDSIEAKERSDNCSDHDCDHFEIPFDAVCDVFDSSGTLVSFSRRKNRRKLNVVMSSDSEDELVNDRVPLTGDRDTNNELTVEADGAFPSHCPSTQNCLSPSTDMQLCFEVEKLDENCSQRPDITIDLNVRETSIPVDVSCVPESTFVPETQINGGTEVSFSRVYCSQVADTLEEVSVSNEFKPNLWPVETDNLDKFVPILQRNS
uniref:ATPase AAA-type core domain-containing protein n=1 Tax=Salix viminalis TaxID=40686 RepID=A0A6N2LUI4_SALVM